MVEFAIVLAWGLTVLFIGCGVSFFIGYYVGWQEQNDE